MDKKSTIETAEVTPTKKVENIENDALKDLANKTQATEVLDTKPKETEAEKQAKIDTVEADLKAKISAGNQNPETKTVPDLRELIEANPMRKTALEFLIENMQSKYKSFFADLSTEKKVRELDKFISNPSQSEIKFKTEGKAIFDKKEQKFKIKEQSFLNTLGSIFGGSRR